MAKGKPVKRGAKRAAVKKPAKASAKKPARAAKPKQRIPADEVDRRLKIARKAASARHASRTKLQDQLAKALEVAQDEAAKDGYDSTLRIASPSRGNVEQPGRITDAGVHGSATGKLQWKTPWVLVGRFRFKGSIGYAGLFDVLSAWARSRVNRSVGIDRVSRLRIVYVTPTGTREEYTLAETAPWQLAIARAKEQCDPEDTETSHPGGARGSLASRYGESRISHVDVWLSDQIGFRRLKLTR